MNTRSLSLVLAAAGAVCLAGALLADVVRGGAFGGDGGGGPGFGKRQLALAALGAALLVFSAARARAWARRSWASAAAARPGTCVLLAAWFGLATGFVEVGHQALRRYALGKLVVRPFDLVWAAPTFYAACFVAIGAVMALAALPRSRRLITLPAVVFAFAFLLAWSQSLLHQELDRTAAIALAAGVAWQCARMAGARAAGFTRAVRRTLPWMSGLVALLAAVFPAARSVAESRALASAPAPPPGAPNVLLVVLDTVRADHMQSHGYHRDTMPNVDALGAGGVVFERAMSLSPWTLPSHAGLFTGRYHYEISADWVVPLDGAHPTLAEVLAARGWATAGFVGNLNYCSSPLGVGRGFQRYDDFAVSPRTVAFCATLGEWLLADAGLTFSEWVRNDARHVTDRFLAWLAERDDEGDGNGDGASDRRPFFAFLNYFDAHALYLTDADYQTRFGPAIPELRQWFTRREWPAPQMAGFVDAYDGCMRFMDDHLQRVVDGLRARGLLDDTLIVVTSDHGEQFGEHGLKDHSNSLYRPLLHVPLVLSFPGRVPAGRRVPDFVSHRDVAATILDLAGVGEGPLPGKSLARFWSDDPAARAFAGTPVLAEVSAGINRPEWEPISRGPMKALFQDGRHYILNGDEKAELYDFAADPAEARNLVETPGGDEIAARMRAEVRRITGR